MSDGRPCASLRRRSRPLAALLAAAAFWALPAAAQDARIITFEEAVRIALEHNSTLKRAENAAAVDEVAVAQARAQFLPDLRFTAQTAQRYGRNFIESEGRIVDQSNRTASLGLSSGVVLFDGFANTASLRGSKLAAEASGLELGRARETVVFTVASNFLALLQAQEQLRVRREALVAEAALEEQIRSYVEAGARTIADLHQQRANVASARFAVVEAERAAQLAEVDLIRTLHLDPRGAYQFEAPAEGVLPAADAVPDLDSLLARALENRADLEAAAARVGAAEQDIRVARAGRWPTISLSAGYNSSYTSASDFDFLDQLDQRRGGSIGIGFSIPLFDGGSVAAASRRAEIQADNARLELEDLRQEVGLQVRRAWLDLRAAREQLDAAGTQQEAAELAFEAARERYQAGAATLVELSQAQAARVQAAAALVTARYNLAFQRMIAEYYAGDLDPARFTAP